MSAVAAATLSAPLAAQAQAQAAARGASTVKAQHSLGAKGKKAAAGSKAQPEEPVPFPCDGQILLTSGPGAAPVTLYSGTAGPGTIAFGAVGAATVEYNAIGVNPVDQFLYGIDTTDDSLVQVSADGSVNDLGAVSGLPASTVGAYIAGAFDSAGNYYVALGTSIYVINVTTRVATVLTNTAVLTAADFTFSNGYFWGASASGDINRIDPTTGVVTTYPDIIPDATGYGGAFTYGNGDIGLVSNDGQLVRVRVTNPAAPTPTFTIISSQTAPSEFPELDATSCFVAEADLSITKTADPGAYTPGQTLTYTITVTNNGPTNQSSGYSVTDTIPAGLVGATTTTAGCTITGSSLSCTAGALAVGESRDITVTGTVGADFAGILTNSAEVSGNDPDPDPTNNIDSVDVPRARVDLSVEKDGPTRVTEGDTVTYTLTVTNNGPNDSTGYTVTDAIPPGLLDADTSTPGCTISGTTLTCVGDDLPAGSSQTITITGTAGPGLTSLRNAATVTGTEPDPDPGNNVDWITSPRNRADLEIRKTGPASVEEGDEVTYRIRVTNRGPHASTGYTITDELPAELEDAATSSPGCSISGTTLTCTVTGLAAGASRTVTVTGTAAEGAKSLTDWATVVGRDIDPDPDNNVYSLTTRVNGYYDDDYDHGKDKDKDKDNHGDGPHARL
ncbi:DUF11 domain-containing protein [Streptomyces sp. NPDC001514]